MSAVASRGDPRVAAFLATLSAERGAAANTLAAYARDLADYVAHLARFDTLAEQADADAIRSYLASLATRDLAPASAARKLSAVRQFHKFLVVEGIRSDDPAAALSGPKRGLTLPKTLTTADVDRLLDVARDDARVAHERRSARLRAARLHALMETLYATGLRVSELVALPKSAARSRDPLLTVRGKGGRERLVPLNPRARAAMALWRQVLDAEAPKLPRRAGCSPRTAQAAISRASISRAS